MRHVANHSRAFTMAEVLTAFAVTSLAGTMLVQLLFSTRTTVRASAERRLATEIAQGALERVRVMSPEGAAGIVADGEPVELALPPAAGRLEDARLTVSAKDWRGYAGLRHVRVQVEWRSSRGGRQKVVREGLASDAHVQ